MWSYYGSKSKIVHLYPRPECDKIIEPFAGTARYSLRYWDRDVLLVDKFVKVVSLWKWLQQCSPQDILKLPEPSVGETVKREDVDCDEALFLMGFLVQQGVGNQRYTVSPFADIHAQKKFISNNLFKIRHWTIQQGDYKDIPNERATWFIDPPYQFGGEHQYFWNNKHLDFAHIAGWSKARDGQVIVCENTKADWMPFLPVAKMNGTIHTTTEAIWTNRPTHYEWQQQKLPLDF